MQGRFNLNNLVTADRGINEKQVDLFRRLLVRVGAQERWAGMMADWLDDDTVPHGVDGAEDGTYLSQSPPYRSANVLVTTTTEMMALPGMTREEFEKIRPYVAALAVGTTINLCTAKAPVLAALVEGGADFGDAELLSANRKEGCYPTKEMLRSMDQAGFPAVSELVGENSDWFRAVTAVRIGTSEFTLYSLIERQQGSSIRTVLRSSGTE
jgi:general secretion pathway protein K